MIESLVFTIRYFIGRVFRYFRGIDWASESRIVILPHSVSGWITFIARDKYGIFYEEEIHGSVIDINTKHFGMWFVYVRYDAEPHMNATLYANEIQQR